jgi:iron complex transport system ATP-binding protein
LAAVLSGKANILRLEDFSVGYNSTLFKIASASFEPGITGIIGNNGKGKTTLLRSLSGLLPLLSGAATLNGKELLSIPGTERAQLLSFNFSSNAVSFPISVYELVSMGRYPYANQWAGLSAGDIKIVEEAMALCGISAFAGRKVNALSDGERQKAFIAKSLAQQTPVMLFDEPTAFLDYASKKYFFNLMKSLAEEQGKIILVSSHDIDFLTSYASHLLMIGDDEAVIDGPAKEVINAEYFKTHFTHL